MKKVCIIGCFAIGHDMTDGQTIKTKTVHEELVKEFGKENVLQIDTYGRIITFFKIPFLVLKALFSSENIVILPGENGLRIIAPLLACFNIFFKRKIMYDVIGGWLPEFVENKFFLIMCLKQFDAIFVETKSMKEKLIEMRLLNIDIIPNCKKLNILNEKEIKITGNNPPCKLCTFSRVMKEKGIEDAISAVVNLNRKKKFVCYELSIYGKIKNDQKKWFDELRKSFPEFIKYKGVIPFDESTLELRKYDALLFPTYYEGEGFAGTIIDAFASGVPVIASDWKYNSEIIESGKTGIVVKAHDDVELMDAIELISKTPNYWNTMKKACILEAMKYLPSNAMKKMIKLIET